uniref:Uncharacterized protein n=1 Tax=Pseudomonas putida TaxID=303 RepID=A0A7M1HWT0_PSEPU|nr:hypothetical protein [Pseudomonas putida]QOQ30777.1 Hypothetical protein [Pseudomonas putida]
MGYFRSNLIRHDAGHVNDHPPKNPHIPQGFRLTTLSVIEAATWQSLTNASSKSISEIKRALYAAI